MIMNRLHIFIILLFASLSLSAQSDRDYIRRGNRLVKDTLYSKAQVQYQKAIEVDNANPQAHYNLGNSLLFQNKAEDAMKEYEQAARMETNKIRRAKVYHNMGVVLQSAKQYDKALACYKNSLRNDPTNDETRYNYVLCLYQMKNQQGGGEDNQDQNQDDKGNDQKNQKDQQEQQKQEKKNEQKQDQQQQPDPEKISKENAEQMLKAAMQDEKATQEKVQQAQQQPQQKRLKKQW